MKWIIYLCLESLIGVEYGNIVNVHGCIVCHLDQTVSNYDEKLSNTPFLMVLDRCFALYMVYTFLHPVFVFANFLKQ